MLAQVNQVIQNNKLLKRILISLVVGIVLAIFYLTVGNGFLRFFNTIETSFEEEIIDPFKTISKGDIRSVSGLISEITHVIERNPGDAQNYLLLAELYHKVGYYHLSIDHLKKAFDLAKNQQDKVKILNLLAVSYFYSGKVEEAEKNLKRALKIKRTSYLTQNLAILYMVQNNSQDAIHLLERQVGIGVKNIGNINLLSRLYMDNTDFKKSIKLLEPLIQDHKIYADLMFNVGMSYFKLKNFSKAEEYFAKSIKQAPDDKTSFYYLGLIHFLQKEYSPAIKNLVKSADLSKLYEKYQPYKTLGKLYYEIGNYTKAIQYLTLSLESNPSHPEPYYYLGNIYFENGQSGLSIKSLEQAKKYHYDDNKINPLLAYTYYDEKKYREAASLLADLLSDDPSNYSLRLYLANCYFQQKHYALASKEFDELVSIYRQDTNILINAITAHTEAGNYTKAVTLLEKAKELMPHNTDLEYKIAELEYRQNNQEAALDHYIRYLSTNKGNNQIYERVAELYYKMDNKEESAFYLQKAQETHKTFLATKSAKIVQLLNKGLYKQAENESIYLLNAFPQNPELFGILSDILMKTGRSYQAISLLRNILRENQGKQEIRYKLAQLLIDQNNLIEGIEHLKYILQNDPQPDLKTYQLLVASYFKLSNYELAKAYAEEGLSRYRHNDHLLYHMALIEERSGNTDKADDLYRHILAINPKTPYKNALSKSLKSVSPPLTENLNNQKPSIPPISQAMKQKNDEKLPVHKSGAQLLVEGKGYLSRGEYSKAEQAFKSAISLQAENKEIYFNLAEALKKQGKSAEANQYFDKYIDLSLGKTP